MRKATFVWLFFCFLVLTSLRPKRYSLSACTDQTGAALSRCRYNHERRHRFKAHDRNRCAGPIMHRPASRALRIELAKPGSPMKRAGISLTAAKDTGRHSDAGETPTLRERPRVRHTDCTLTWHGITCTERYDVGVAGSATACRKSYNYEANRW